METAHDLDEMLARYEQEHDDPFAAVMGSMRWRERPEREGTPVTPTPVETARRRLLVAELTGRGLSQQEIAAKIGAARNTIKEDQHALGIDTQKAVRGPRNRRRVEERERIAKMFVEDGLTPVQIAEETGLSASAVRERLKTAGVWQKGRVPPVAHIPLSVVGNALVEMSKLGTLVGETDLSTVDLTAEEARVWEQACRVTARAVSKARRYVKGNETP